MDEFEHFIVKLNGREVEKNWVGMSSQRKTATSLRLRGSNDQKKLQHCQF